MHQVHSSPLLRLALLVDAVISGASGVLQVAAPERLSTTLQLPQALLEGTGQFYLAYAAALLWLATRQRLWLPLAQLIVFGNLAWGLAGLAGLLSDGLTPNALGTGFVLMQVLAVTAFAAVQWLGLRRSVADAASSATNLAARGRAG